MLKYDKNRRCEKCNAGRAQVKFCKEPKWGMLCFKEAKMEHFHRTCAVCSFEWLEVPEKSVPLTKAG